MDIYRIFDVCCEIPSAKKVYSELTYLIHTAVYSRIITDDTNTEYDCYVSYYPLSRRIIVGVELDMDRFSNINEGAFGLPTEDFDSEDDEHIVYHKKINVDKGFGTALVEELFNGNIYRSVAHILWELRKDDII